MSYHPLAYHLLDVAATAEALLDARPLTRARAGHLLGITPDDACRLLVALIALHDLGKFAPAFQAKCPEHWPAALGPCDPTSLRGTRHTDDGFVLWESAVSSTVLERLWPSGRTALRTLAAAIFGHHGRPVTAQLFRPSASQVLGPAGIAAARQYVDVILALLHPRPIDAPDLAPERARLASWWVAGLTTIADWAGSNRSWFPYTPPLTGDEMLGGYWTRARNAARRAVLEAGLVAPSVSPHKSFAELTGISEVPSPAQQWAERVDIFTGPVLAIVEDVTGSGKTEAAQMLVHRLMAAGRASGAYWAMPTQATANAMYGRQEKAITALYACNIDVVPSLVLAHGQQRLHERFRATVLGPDRAGTLRDMADAQDDEPSSSVSCPAFLADDRRAALLADVGAGTVDQALLGVLPSRFNAVRLFGLSEKAVVVDEAHAYDAYMGVEVQELLRFQAALGGSAIVLSATLTLEQRERMVAAWTEGLGGGARRAGLFANPAPLTHSSHYPLATTVTNATPAVREEPLDAAPRSRRSVAVRFVNTVEDALDHVVGVAERGGAVAWVRNTVDDCLQAAELVRRRGVEPLIFHARFAQGDRQEREAQILGMFGPKAAAEQRRGRVVVATQVIEQSLDLDFDAMVSDLAPVDFLIQRAGRLQRHPGREAGRPKGPACELVVLAPAFVEDAPADWLGGPFAGTAHVYRRIDVLWRTVRALGTVRAITTPGGVRELIESVYGPGAVPEALLAIANRVIGEESGNAAAATYATLKATDGYDASAQAWVNDIRARTRLSDEQTTVRLARVLENDTLAPWVESDGPAWKAWALSEVRVRAWKVPPGSRAESRFDAAIAGARDSWGKYERDIAVLPLIPDNAGGFQGKVLLPDADTVRRVGYDRKVGLSFYADQ